jgi:hypothetical protein
MQKRTRSILEELESMHTNRDAKYIIESRADNVIASALNLIELMEQTYSADEVENLTRKLLNSIKLKDSDKFKRSLRRVSSKPE